MVSHAKPDGGQRTRQLRSRYGCRNCKLRKLKCDEAKPRCQKCRAYGVLCNFEQNVRDLQSLSEKKNDNTALPAKRLVILRPAISESIWSSDGSTFFVLDALDQALFKRYRDRTWLSITGLPVMDQYGNYTLGAAFKHPCLMHGLLAVAAVHDRFLGMIPSNRRTFRELNHWSQCTALFAKLLSGTIREGIKDVCWATASTLGILTFSSTDADMVRKQPPWPLGPEDPSDLEWLRIGAGKMKLFQLLNPIRPQSAFQPLAHLLARISQPPPDKGVVGMLPELAEFCDMDELSTLGSNRYFNIAHGLSELLQARDDDPQDAYGTALMVSGHMGGDFAILLRERDPTALTLLCMWFREARKTKWWIEMRARYEYTAIRTYMQQHHGDNVAVRKLLQF